LSAVVGDLSVICRWLQGHWSWLAPAINGTGHQYRIVPTYWNGAPGVTCRVSAQRSTIRKEAP
jgi:hypothetical protein